ncbi:50S ribosomal protein L10 [Kribbella sp. NPDC026611]|uniref:50S ribosomal protein L10 n=1 Tax=Kribbella sp. NPDC026611 TaxID=3154911 RepID=UPI0033E72EA9
MARPDKAAAVAELTDEFRSSNGAVLTEYRGLTVAQLKQLRVALGDDVNYAVVKNTLTKIAAKDAGVDSFDALLEGPSAIAFIKGDPVVAAKGLRDFAKANPLLVIKGGVLEGKALGSDEITKLADLESREVLLAKLAGAMKAAPQQAVSLFAAPLSQAARLFAALQDKLQAEGGAPAPADAPAEASNEEPVAADS